MKNDQGLIYYSSHSQLARNVFTALDETPDFTAKSVSMLENNFLSELWGVKLLYMKLSRKIEANDNDEAIKRSFNFSIQKQLKEILLSMGEFHESLLKESDIENTPSNNFLCKTWSEENKRKCNFLIRLLHSLRNQTGPIILCNLFSQILTGSKADYKLSIDILKDSFAPYKRSLIFWTEQGKIQGDVPCFFVRKLQIDNKSKGAWFSSFELVKEYVPPFLSEKIAETVFQLGRNSYFASQLGLKIESEVKGIDIFDTRSLVKNRMNLHRILQTELSISDTVLLKHILSNYMLLSELELMKNTLLLCDENFAFRICEVLWFNQGISISRKQQVTKEIQRTVEESFKAMKIQNLSASKALGSNIRMGFVNSAKTLDVNALRFSFVLSHPLDLFFRPESWERVQNEFFTFFLKIRLLNFELKSLWKQKCICERRLSNMRNSDVYSKELESVLKQIGLGRRLMMEFMQSYSSHLYQNVVDDLWNSCVEGVQNSKNIDAVTKAVQVFCNSIKNEIGLSETDISLNKQLVKITRTITAFCKASREVFDIISTNDSIKNLEKVLETLHFNFIKELQKLIFLLREITEYSWLSTLLERLNLNSYFK